MSLMLGATAAASVVPDPDPPTEAVFTLVAGEINADPEGQGYYRSFSIGNIIPDVLIKERRIAFLFSADIIFITRWDFALYQDGGGAAGENYWDQYTIEGTFANGPGTKTVLSSDMDTDYSPDQEGDPGGTVDTWIRFDDPNGEHMIIGNSYTVTFTWTN